MSRIDELGERYRAAMHAVQSGVAMMMQFDQKDTTPKHLRVGVNSALVDSAALASLLMKKGLFTEEEYLEELAMAAEKEQANYEKRLAEWLGKGVVLG